MDQVKQQRRYPSTKKAKINYYEHRGRLAAANWERRRKRSSRGGHRAERRTRLRPVKHVWWRKLWELTGFSAQSPTRSCATRRGRRAFTSFA